MNGDASVFSQADVAISTSKLHAVLASEAIRNLTPLPPPADNRAVPLHMAFFSIQVQSGTERRAVNVYHPESLPPSPELARFWAAWNEIWTLMPQWKLVPSVTPDMLPTPPKTPTPP